MPVSARRRRLTLLGFLALSPALVATPHLSSGHGSRKPGQPEPQVEGLASGTTDSLTPGHRLVIFTTTEGTWMSLDVSPDGRTIVFDLLGDLYTLPIEGGAARRITSERGFDAMPRWSADGQWIVFASDRSGGSDLWRIRADGSDPRQIFAQIEGGFTSPSFTADGQSVIAATDPIRASPSKMAIYPVDGGPTRPLPRDSTKLRAEPSSPHGSAVSRDGKYLYYSAAGGGFSLTPVYQIHRRDLSNGNDETVTNAPAGAMRPAVSADGGWLAFATRYDGQTGIRLRDLATGRERWLIYPIDRDNLEASFGASRDLLPAFAFTPNGRELVLALDRKLRRVDVATGAVREIPMTAEVSLELGPQLRFSHRLDTGSVRARYLGFPAFAPDGKRLAFTAFGRLHLGTIEGGVAARPLAGAEKGIEPAWSPDGRWIAYVTHDPDSGGAVWKVLAEGGAPIRLTSDRGAWAYRGPAWTPDGSAILVNRQGYDLTHRRAEWSSPRKLVAVPAGGGDVTIISEETRGRPHFTAAGDRIYFSGYDGLQSMARDGSGQRRHLNLIGPPGRNAGAWAQDWVVSPDAKQVLVRIRQELYLVQMPPSSDTTAVIVHVNSPRLPTKLLSSTGVDFFGWIDGGRTIAWTIGATLFRLPVDQIEFPSLPATPYRGNGGRSDSVHALRRVPDPSKPVRPTAVDIGVERPRARPSGAMVLKGARVITMAGAVIEKGDIVVRGDRIVAVGPTGTVAMPADARVFDLTGKTVIPGFVDLHPHWDDLDLDFFNDRPWSLEAVLAYGVTTGRLPGGGGEKQAQFAYADAQLAGDLVGPRIFVAEPNVGSEVEIGRQEDADSLVSKFRRYYRTDFLKLYLTGPRSTRQAIAEAAARYQILAISEGGFDFGLQLTNLMDGFAIEHTFTATPLGDDVIQLIARAGASYDPTLVVNQGSQGTVTAQDRYLWTKPLHSDPKARRFIAHEVIDRKIADLKWRDPIDDPTPSYAADVARVARAGGNVVIGSHSEMEGLSFHWEMWSFARGGMTPMEILTAATINGAKALGYDRDLGSIEVGKLADLIVLSANPLDDIQNTATIRFVVRGGVVHDGETLDELWPIERRRPAPLWEKDEPVRR